MNIEAITVYLLLNSRRQGSKDQQLETIMMHPPIKVLAAFGEKPAGPVVQNPLPHPAVAESVEPLLCALATRRTILKCLAAAT